MNRLDSPLRVRDDNPRSQVSDPTVEVELTVMQLLQKEPAISQRELAQRLGVSLGKAHYLLRALLDKGWVKARNFRRNDNKLGYAYLLTAAGLREKAALTRHFLQMKEAEYELLSNVIARLRREIQLENES